MCVGPIARLKHWGPITALGELTSFALVIFSFYIIFINMNKTVDDFCPWLCRYYQSSHGHDGALWHDSMAAQHRSRPASNCILFDFVRPHTLQFFVCSIPWAWSFAT